MTTATLSSKFQLAIPKDVREQLSLQAGQKFTILTKGKVITLVPIRSLASVRGSLKGANTKDYRDHQSRY